MPETDQLTRTQSAQRRTNEQWRGAGGGKLRPVTCSWTSCELRVIFTFLKCYKMKRKKKHTHTERKICDRDHMWPAEPQLFIIWLFTEILLTPGIEGGLGWGGDGKSGRLCYVLI